MENVHHLPDNPNVIAGVRIDDPDITDDDLAAVVAHLTEE
jgi:hypothetical protein